MSTNHALHACVDEDDYIDMELTTSSPSKPTEFEFQMSFSSNGQKQHDDNNSTSPADELFYRGQLLPLHLPPRQQMVEKLAAAFEITDLLSEEGHNYYYHSMPLDSCRVSCEGSFADRFFDSSGDLSRFINDRPMSKPSSKKLIPVKRYSVLGQKLKASSAYLKSLFTKSVANENLSKVEALLSKYLKVSKRGSFGHVLATSCPKIATFIEDNNINDNVHRKSFSGAIKRVKCLSSSSSDSSSGGSSSSSSFSFRSNGQCDLNPLRRSSSVNEIEASIDAAIDHCKKSMKIFHAINSSEDDEKKARSNL